MYRVCRAAIGFRERGGGGGRSFLTKQRRKNAECYLSRDLWLLESSNTGQQIGSGCTVSMFILLDDQPTQNKMGKGNKENGAGRGWGEGGGYSPDLTTFARCEKALPKIYCASYSQP